MSDMNTIKTDQKVPDFRLKDFNGKIFRLADHLGKAHVLLVFNRGFT